MDCFSKGVYTRVQLTVFNLIGRADSSRPSGISSMTVGFVNNSMITVRINILLYYEYFYFIETINLTYILIGQPWWWSRLWCGSFRWCLGMEPPSKSLSLQCSWWRTTLYIILRPLQNGHHFAKDILACNVFRENHRTIIRIPLKFLRIQMTVLKQ